MSEHRRPSMMTGVNSLSTSYHGEMPVDMRDKALSLRNIFSEQFADIAWNTPTPRRRASIGGDGIATASNTPRSSRHNRNVKLMAPIPAAWRKGSSMDSLPWPHNFKVSSLKKHANTSHSHSTGSTLKKSKSETKLDLGYDYDEREFEGLDVVKATKSNHNYKHSDSMNTASTVSSSTRLNSSIYLIDNSEEISDPSSTERDNRRRSRRRNSNKDSLGSSSNTGGRRRSRSRNRSIMSSSSNNNNNAHHHEPESPRSRKSPVRTKSKDHKATPTGHKATRRKDSRNGHKKVKRSSSKKDLSASMKEQLSISQSTSTTKDKGGEGAVKRKSTASTEEEDPASPPPKPVPTPGGVQSWICTCGYELPLVMKFCGKCGKSKHWTCREPSCQFDENLCDYRFCGNCGTTREREQRCSTCTAGSERGEQPQPRERERGCRRRKSSSRLRRKGSSKNLMTDTSRNSLLTEHNSVSENLGASEHSLRLLDLGYE